MILTRERLLYKVIWIFFRNLSGRVSGRSIVLTFRSHHVFGAILKNLKLPNESKQWLGDPTKKKQQVPRLGSSNGLSSSDAGERVDKN
ncbi:hypothetical protein M8C21_026771 [Ambrosia artemisiifolia]|uniref:Uncharacterized protein n=1 Tax=Ambrosia artemisiifolia TaxID=4212 RepID=A0AAD5GEB9_AMBAR|nr:hypothetical protein M8C21_026771 [Ambrosia artemisiifolia]